MKITHDELRAEAQGEGLEGLDTQAIKVSITAPITYAPPILKAGAEVLFVHTTLSDREKERLNSAVYLKEYLLDKAARALAEKLVSNNKFITVASEYNSISSKHIITHSLRVVPCV